jgi:hypothetical protein
MADLETPLAGTGSSAPDPRTPLLVLSVASVFELIAAAVVCGTSYHCTGLDAYAVTAGGVSCVVCIPLLLMYFDFFEFSGTRFAEHAPNLALFLLAWWSVAWLVLTFVSPFTGLTNGFFACWVAPFAALLFCRALTPLVSEPLGRMVAALRGAGAERSVLILLCASSTAVWVSASVALGRYPDIACDPTTHECMHYNGIKVWAICVGVVSMGACGVYLTLEAASPYGYSLALAQSVWWLQGLAISFVPSVFGGGVNGWACTWLSVGLAGYFASLSRNPRVSWRRS